MTPFGDRVRKLRDSKGTLLKQMAKDLQGDVILAAYESFSSLSRLAS